MNTIAAKEIQKHLEPGEELIWAGQPQQGVFFVPMDFFKILYTIPCLLVTYFIIKSAAKVSIVIAITVGTIFFSGIILIGIASFFIDTQLRKHTFYGLTKKRIIIKSNKFPKILKSVRLDAKLKIEFLPNLGNTSTIDLGITAPSSGGGGGMRWSPNIKSYTSLYRLTDANFVHQQIRQILASPKNTNENDRT